MCVSARVSLASAQSPPATLAELAATETIAARTTRRCGQTELVPLVSKPLVMLSLIPVARGLAGGLRTWVTVWFFLALSSGPYTFAQTSSPSELVAEPDNPETQWLATAHLQSVPEAALPLLLQPGRGGLGSARSLDGSHAGACKTRRRLRSSTPSHQGPRIDGTDGRSGAAQPPRPSGSGGVPHRRDRESAGCCASCGRSVSGAWADMWLAAPPLAMLGFALKALHIRPFRSS